MDTIPPPSEIEVGNQTMLRHLIIKLMNDLVEKGYAIELVRGDAFLRACARTRMIAKSSKRMPRMPPTSMCGLKTMSSLDGITRTIRFQKAVRAADRAATPGEAEAALNAARRLMEAYRIDSRHPS